MRRIVACGCFSDRRLLTIASALSLAEFDSPQYSLLEPAGEDSNHRLFGANTCHHIAKGAALDAKPFATVLDGRPTTPRLCIIGSRKRTSSSAIRSLLSITALNPAIIRFCAKINTTPAANCSCGRRTASGCTKNRAGSNICQRCARCRPSRHVRLDIIAKRMKAFAHVHLPSMMPRYTRLLEVFDSRSRQIAIAKF